MVVVVISMIAKTSSHEFLQSARLSTINYDFRGGGVVK
jgi:hypothetical protein